ncbi:testis-specific serine/threonine-protein kinase 4-like [Haliotis asinina]|uniref:testis-specific serine/threonine-protein kinase 4-like n=1 Tax=Haliotis asinina TaxID=109174 RepID=UPI0035326D28
MSGAGGPAQDNSSAKRGESRSSRRFQILEAQGLIVGKTLGNGSYACVKSAYDVNKKSKVAIKIISKRKAPEDYLTKFLPREIEVVRILRHPNLIKFHQVIETTTRFFLIMEISENGDLLEHIRKRRVIEEKLAGRWMRNLLDGICYMHSKGIVHRDLKCENLLVDNNLELKVTDFGFAKRLFRTKGNEVVLSETYCGSYAYAPPEILKGVPYNPYCAEVWSIGVVLFTMVYGRLPFDDSDHKKLLRQVQAKVIFPSKPEVSENCRILILKMLTKPSDRIPIANIRFDTWYKTLCVLPDEPRTTPTKDNQSLPSAPQVPDLESEGSTAATTDIKEEPRPRSPVVNTLVDIPPDEADDTVAKVKALGQMLSQEQKTGVQSPGWTISDESVT